MAKEIHLAKWNGNTLVYSIPNKNNPERLADFQGQSKIKKFVIVNHIFVSPIRRFPEGEYGRAWILQSIDRVEVKTSFFQVRIFFPGTKP